MAYCQRVWGHMGDVDLHKLCTLLYYLVQLQSALVGSVKGAQSGIQKLIRNECCHVLKVAGTLFLNIN